MTARDDKRGEADFLRQVRDILAPLDGVAKFRTSRELSALDMIGDRLIAISAPSHVAPTNQWAGTEIIFDASAPSTTPRSEAAERVANFLRVLDRVWPNHPDRLLTTGAATALLKSDLQALVSVASAIVPNGWKLVPVAPTDEMWTRFTQRTISSLTTG